MMNEYYDGSVKVPKEISDVNDGIVFGLTIRNVLFGVLAVVVCSVITLFLKNLGFANEAAILAGLFFASPALAFGFAKPGGLHLEDYLMIWYSNNVKSSRVRKIYAENAYEEVLKPPKQKKKKKRKHQKTSYKFTK